MSKKQRDIALAISDPISPSSPQPYTPSHSFDPCDELKAFVANYPANKQSSRQIFISAGQGTTGTHTIAKLMSKAINGTITHWVEEYHNGEEKHTGMGQNVTDTLLGILPEELDDFDFRPHFEKIDGLSDWPVPSYFPFIFRQFPNARVVLSVRDPHQWAEKRDEWDQRMVMPFMFSLDTMRHMMHRNGKKQATAGKMPHPLAAYLFSVQNTVVKCLVPEEQLVVVNLFQEDMKDVEAKISNLAASIPRRK